MSDDDLVTVMVPARNEEDSIGECLDSILAQDHKALQVVVVDGGSTDATTQIVRERMSADDRVELLETTRASIPASLNLAVAQARGRWLVRVDAHSTVSTGYVRACVDRLREGTWGGVGGRKDGVGKTPAGRAIAAAMGSRFGVGNSVYHYGTEPQEVDHLPFGAYAVDLVRRVGGWDERLVANEDYEFDYRLRQAGMRLLFDPAMRIDWQCRQSVPDLFRQYRRYGRGKFDVARLHPDSLGVRHLAPPALVGYVAVAALLNAGRPVRLAVLVSPYVAAVLAASIKTARKLDKTGDKMLVPAAFAAMHVGWGLGFWAGAGRLLVRGRRGSSNDSFVGDHHAAVVEVVSASLEDRDSPGSNA